jgi:hypothetical protein
VVELDLGVMPSPAGSGELLLVDEWSCRLVFVTSGGSGVGVATFKGCRQALFGYPNDEAQPGHPLYPAGGWSYGFYEVLGSDWAARLWTQNRVVFPIGHPPTSGTFLSPAMRTWWRCSPTTSRSRCRSVRSRLSRWRRSDTISGTIVDDTIGPGSTDKLGCQGGYAAAGSTV